MSSEKGGLLHTVVFIVVVAQLLPTESGEKGGGYFMRCQNVVAAQSKT